MGRERATVATGAKARAFFLTAFAALEEPLFHGMSSFRGLSRIGVGHDFHMLRFDPY